MNNKNLVSIREIHKSFQTGDKTLHVLKGLNLDIQTGETLAIVGASGVGKSTFLQILGALDCPTSGDVYFENVDIFSLDDNELANFRNQNIGFVFQFHHLLPEFTALENVMMPALIRKMKKSKAEDMAKQILDEVGLAERLSHKPGELSGGEQQRVAVARALILDPRIVLADEPTGNLDTKTGDSVFQLIRKLNKDKNISFVIVTHNDKLADQTDKIVHMVDGKVMS